MAQGIRIQDSTGALVIKNDSQNMRIVGPVTATTTAQPPTTSASMYMEYVSTHVATITSDMVPLIYLQLPAYSATVGTGAAVTGVVNTATNTYKVYFVAYNCTPTFYYTTTFAIAPAVTGYGMAMYDAAGTLVWNSNEAMHKVNYYAWAASVRVGTMYPLNGTIWYTNGTYAATGAASVTRAQVKGPQVTTTAGAVRGTFYAPTPECYSQNLFRLKGAPSIYYVLSGYAVDATNFVWATPIIVGSAWNSSRSVWGFNQAASAGGISLPYDADDATAYVTVNRNFFIIA